jgi:hypothetical protein
MFRSMLAGKSRHKAAILGGALAGVLTPLAAHASLTVSFSLSSTVAGIGAAPTRVYIDPTETADIPVYVYATVTGTVAADYQGVQYLYYNVNNAVTHTGTAAVDPADTAATAFPSAFTASVGGSGDTSTFGAIVNTANGISVGDTTNNTLGNMVHPRVAAGAPIFGSTGVTQTFLVETLEVKPSAFTASTATTLNASRFYPTVPSVATFAADYGAEYAEANWNEDSSSNVTATPSSVRSTNGSGGSLGTYSASGTGVVIADTIAGDTNHDGQVSFGDYETLLADYGTGTTWEQGDFHGSGVTGFSDYESLLANYGDNLNTVTNNVIEANTLAMFGLIATPNADGVGFSLSGVPEPTSAALLGIAGFGMLSRRRRGAVK